MLTWKEAQELEKNDFLFYKNLLGEVEIFYVTDISPHQLVLCDRDNVRFAQFYHSDFPIRTLTLPKKENNMNSPIDNYADQMIENGLSGIRIIISKGSKNSWHAYVVLLGLKGVGEKRMLETSHCETYLDALSELEENVMRDLRARGRA